MKCHRDQITRCMAAQALQPIEGLPSSLMKLRWIPSLTFWWILWIHQYQTRILSVSNRQYRRILDENLWIRLVYNLLVFVGECCKCGQRVVGEGSGCTAMNKVYHIPCFTCCHCDMPLQGKPFYSLDGKPYCEQGYLVLLCFMDYFSCFVFLFISRINFFGLGNVGKMFRVSEADSESYSARHGSPVPSALFHVCRLSQEPGRHYLYCRRH